MYAQAYCLILRLFCYIGETCIIVYNPLGASRWAKINRVDLLLNMMYSLLGVCFAKFHSNKSNNAVVVKLQNVHKLFGLV